MKRIRRLPMDASDGRARIPGQDPRRSRRRGIESLELILVGPILWMLTLALFEFGFLVLILQAIMSGTGESAREAAKFGMTTEQRFEAAVEVMRQFLAPHDIEFDEFVYLLVEDGDEGTMEFLPANGLTCDPPPSTVPDKSVRVTVCIRVTDARVPDWLSTCALIWGDRQFEISAVVPKE